MKNGSSGTETYLASSTIPITRRARQEVLNNLSVFVRSSVVEPVERKAIRYPSHLVLKVLAPIDLSGHSKRAVDYAIDVAKAMGAELSLLNVADPQSRIRGVTRPRFDPTLPGSIGQFVVTGSVPETITSFAEFIDADFVLMTSENYRGRTSFWKRSTTADVMKSTDRPILVTEFAHGNARFHCRRILCALALDGSDDATILQAEALARRSGGELILLSVVPDLGEGMLQDVLSDAAHPLSTYLANDRLQAVGRRLSVLYKTSVMIGSTYRCIGLAARQYTADIVVASRSTLDMRAVFRRLTCPLLSVANRIPSLRSIEGRVVNSPHALEYAGDSLQ